MEQLPIAEKIYDKIDKNEKVDDLSELYKVLALLRGDAQDEVLTHTYFKKQVLTLGIEPPRTQDIILHIARKILGNSSYISN